MLKNVIIGKLPECSFVSVFQVVSLSSELPHKQPNQQSGDVGLVADVVPQRVWLEYLCLR